MSKIDPIFQVISISTVILFGSLTPTMAAKPLEKQKERFRLPETNFIQQTAPSSLKIESNVSSLISQAPEEPPSTESETTESETTESEASKLERLEPNPDPLSIPTKPEEVEINIDEPITLEEAIKLAIDNNKDLQESRLNLERSLKELSEARAALYPSLALQSDLTNSQTASAERSNEASRLREELQGGIRDDDELGIDDSTTSFDGDLTLSYNIYTGGNRGADIRRAKKQVEFNELDLERVTEQTIFEAKRDYYSLQDADSQVEIEQAAVEDASQTLKDAQLLEQAGLGTRFDVLRAEVELANAQQRLTSAEATRTNARRQLVETLSLGEQVDLQTADEIAKAGTWNLAIEESIISAYENRAELEQFLVNREINQEQRKIALSTIRPQVSIFGAFDFLKIFDDEVTATDIQTRERGTEEIGFTTGYTVGLRLQWTIFDGGAAKARARQEDVDVALAENGFANQENTVRLEVEQAFFSLQANDENIGTSSKAVELAEESLRLARLRFQAGVGTQTDVIEAQTELTTARGNFLRAIVDYNQSLNQLQRAVTGVPDTQTDIPVTPEVQEIPE